MERLMDRWRARGDSGARVTRGRWTISRVLRRLHERYGGWVWLALVLLCACALAVTWMVWLQQRLDEVQRAELALLSQASAPQPDQAAHGLSSKERLQAFDAFLIDPASVPQRVQDLFRAADDQGLTLERGSYESQVDASGGFMRVRMTLPVRGPVESVHTFVRQALLAQPQLALEAVRFKRDGAQSREVEAQLTWVLFSKPGATQAGGVGAGAIGGVR